MWNIITEKYTTNTFSYIPYSYFIKLFKNPKYKIVLKLGETFLVSHAFENLYKTSYGKSWIRIQLTFMELGAININLKIKQYHVSPLSVSYRRRLREIPNFTAQTLLSICDN